MMTVICQGEGVRSGSVCFGENEIYRKFWNNQSCPCVGNINAEKEKKNQDPLIDCWNNPDNMESWSCGLE